MTDTNAIFKQRILSNAPMALIQINIKKNINSKYLKGHKHFNFVANL